ncbi:MAG: hypothetical protein JWN01_538 [Patescibacteria group bacterium]|nr:hypothetical protein [Patescibacteria group bacterium]
MKHTAHHELARREADYEQITRQIRWLAIVIIFVTFPLNQPQSLLVYGFLVLTALYNLSRYMPALIRTRLYASRVMMLTLDNVVVAIFLLLVGQASTPYSGLLILMLIAATYWFGIRGMLVVLVSQALVVAGISVVHPFQPLVLGPSRVAALSALILLAIGLLVERLTHVERHERLAFESLSDENQTERDQLLALVNSLHDAILVVDAKGRVVLSNAAAQELSGAQGNLHGRDISRLLPVRHRARGRVQFLSILKDSSTPQRRRDLTMAGVDGRDLDLDITITPIKNLKDTNYIIVCNDITKEKSLDQQREEFIAIASHELRTPLTIVEAALSTALLSRASFSPPITTMLDQAHRNTVFLAGIVKDLTTLSQAQNDNIPIQLAPVNPRTLLDQLVKDFTPQAKGKGLSFTRLLMPDTPSVLSTEHHIHEILQNYISNALKYTKEGGVQLKAEPGRNGGVVFAIQDSGIGISAGDQRHLFTKFYRSENYRTRETGGTGLGLYLCLELAERINGRVWCKSTLNHGSTFYLEVPPFSRLQRDHAKVVEAEVSTLIDQL